MVFEDPSSEYMALKKNFGTQYHSIIMKIECLSFSSLIYSWFIFFTLHTPEIWPVGIVLFIQIRQSKSETLEWRDWHMKLVITIGSQRKVRFQNWNLNDQNFYYIEFKLLCFFRSKILWEFWYSFIFQDTKTCFHTYKACLITIEDDIHWGRKYKERYPRRIVLPHFPWYQIRPSLKHHQIHKNVPNSHC